MQTEKQKALTLKLADFIESKKYEFNMNRATAQPHCGIAGCIGSHAAVLWPSLRRRPFWSTNLRSYSWNVHQLVKKLGFTEHQHDQLLVPTDHNDGHIFFMHVTRSMAVAALRRLVKTGRFYFSKKDRP